MPSFRSTRITAAGTRYAQVLIGRPGRFISKYRDAFAVPCLPTIYSSFDVVYLILCRAFYAVY